MQVRIKGVLVSPTATILPLQEIRITAIDSEGTLSNITTSEYTDVDGKYDFPLLFGKYHIEVFVGGTYLAAGDVLVDLGLPTEVSLPTLFGYSVYINPEGIITYPPYWQDKINAVKDGIFSTHREHREQIVDTLVHVGDVKSTSVDEDGTSRVAEYITDLASCDSRIGSEALVYSDAEGNFTANEGHTITTGSASKVHKVLMDTDIDETTVVVADTAQDITDVTVSTGYQCGSAVSIGSDVVYNSYYAGGVDGVEKVEQLSKGTSTIDKSTSVELDEIKENTTYITGSTDCSRVLSLTDTHIDDLYNMTVNGKTNTVDISNDGFTTTEEHIVDIFKVGRIGNTLLEADSKDNTVYIRGKLRVEDLQDKDGNPIIPEDGDTIFQVFQYSDTASGPWETTIQPYHVWKRDNFSVNGVIDPNTWSIAYRFVPEGGIPGTPGDTRYEEYQYSADGVTNWHDGLRSGDKWRRSRWVVNGVAGPWSDVGRIVGDDGPQIETRSQYSVDGIYDWHDVLEPADRFERRAVFINGAQDGPWSDPFPIGRGENGLDGADGADGSKGVDARAVNLTTTVQGFAYNSSGLVPVPSSATITATAVNTEGTVYYQFFKDDVKVQEGTGNVYSYAAPANISAMPDKIEVQIREGSLTNPILARDQLTLFGLREGSDAVTISLSNEAHTVPCDSAGNPTSFAGSGTDIRVWLGATALNYATSGANTFSVTASASNVVAGAASTVSSNIRRYADITSFTANVGSITFTITVRDSAGATRTLTRIQSFAKAKDGSSGEDGDTIFEEYRYGATNNLSDGTWTAWGGTQLDTHFWRQARLVTNGVAGTPGVVHRIIGKPGSGWYSIVGRGGVFPADAIATVDFINNFGRAPTLDDHLTYVDIAMPSTTKSDVKRCNSPEGSPVTWSTPSMAVKGDLIVRGTISGDRLVANTITGNQISSATTIIAGSGSWTAGMNGDDSAGAGIYQNWRFWSGATNPALAPFRVDRNGNLYADSGRFRGNIELIGTNYMSISSSEGFGSTNQFLEWTGPKAIDSNGDPIMSQVREATAIKYFKTNGDAYFGGSILAGTLKNAAQSSQKATSVSIDTGTYSSNGDIITIKGSIQLSVTVTGTGACPVRDNPVATLKLYSVSSSGAETNVLTHVVTGTYRCVLESGGNIQDYFISGSFTYTDPVQSTADRRYKLTVTHDAPISSGVPTSSQYLSIISEE